MKSQLKRQVFNKKEFNNTIDNKFTQLISQPDPSFYDINLASIDDFFSLYDKFFYEYLNQEKIIHMNIYTRRVEIMLGLKNQMNK